MNMNTPNDSGKKRTVNQPSLVRGGLLRSPNRTVSLLERLELDCNQCSRVQEETHSFCLNPSPC